MLELFVIAVHIADNVHHTLRELQERLEVGDFGNRGVNSGKPVGQGAECADLWQWEMRYTRHFASS
jgi:hypothetical protein